MDKCEKLGPSTNENDCKKYKFYRKPSIKKTVPEVKHTRTSLARLKLANPLLELENKPKINQQKKLKSKPNDLNAPKVSITNFSGNCKNSNISRCRLSSSDFKKPLLSSTLSEVNEVFVKVNSPLKLQKDVGKNNQNDENSNFRKSLSSKHFDKKKKEFQEISRRGTTKLQVGSKCLRRSISMDNFNKQGCYRIEEENDLLATDSQSMNNLHQLKQQAGMLPFSSNDHLSTGLSLLKESQKGLDNWLVKHENNISLNHYSNDEENKENTEVALLTSESYEDLKIPKDVVANKNPIKIAQDILEIIKDKSNLNNFKYNFSSTLH